MRLKKKNFTPFSYQDQMKYKLLKQLYLRLAFYLPEVAPIGCIFYTLDWSTQEKGEKYLK